MIEVKNLPATEETDKFTVSPVDKETKLRFQKFRIEDVQDQFFYACLF